MNDSQDRIFTFLADPATHGIDGPVRRVDTHGAAVFLAGPDVYKVKRAVRFPFMDLSTLEKRRLACEAEVSINRRFAPDLYLGTVAITEGPEGLGIDGDGAPVEWAVHLKRFDETMTLDLVAGRGELEHGTVFALAHAVREAHEAAEICDGAAATKALAGVVAETADELLEAPDLFPPDRAAAFSRDLRAAFDRARPLLLARGKAGRVRWCHGDLHLRNIVLIGRRATLFDAIEFDATIAITDVLYDLAFLLMDLWERGFRREANVVLNRYLWGIGPMADEIAGLAALPLFLALRAAVRAKVEALRWRGAAEKGDIAASARQYFDAAVAFLEPVAPRLVAVGGLSGTGKTTLAGRLAPAIGRAPGALHLRSDIERKRLMQVDEFERLPESAYRAEVTERVFASLRAQAAAGLAAGQGVIVDAVHLHADEREAIAAVAEQARAPFAGLWLEAPVETLIERVSHRAADASDALRDVVLLQASQPVGDMTWTRLDATLPMEARMAKALAAAGVAQD